MNSSDSPLSHLCTLCQEAFPSKTKLFKHLVVHGFESNSLKPTKVVLLIGWLAHKNEDEDEWISDQAWSSHKGDFTSFAVEQAVFRALYAIENNLDSLDHIPNGGKESIVERPKGFSRGTSCLQRTSVLFSTEPTCHALCDTFCFHIRPLGIKTMDTFVSELNSFLDEKTRVLHGYELSSESASSFHAETECTQRRYEYMIPLRVMMPLAYVHSPKEKIVRISKFRNTLQSSNASLMDQHFPLETEDGQQRIGYFRRLKEIFKELTGHSRKSFHNYITAGATPGNDSCYRRADRIYHKSLLTLGDKDKEESWVVFSVSGDTLLRGQVRKLLGISLAVALDFLPMEYLHTSLTDAIVDVPALPGCALYLAECRYANWEAKFTDLRLDPRRHTSATCAKVLHDEDMGIESIELKRWGEKIRNVVVEQCREVFSDSFIDDFRGQCIERMTKYTLLQSLEGRIRSDTKSEFLSKFRVEDSSGLDEETEEVSEGSPDEPVDAPSSPNPHTAEEQQETMEASTDQPVKKHNVRETELYKRRKLQLTHIHIAPEYDDCPAVYRNVLRLLRDADRSGLWPSSSTGRQQVIMDKTLLEHGGRGGSFSVGALPKHLVQPKGNALFPELMHACFLLEKHLCFHRPPSATIAINRHAQFLPHRDTGAGAGQTLSLIVGLGGYVGGEIIVDHTAHDIRYKPLEFNGWKQIHYTLPFVGERYSLVWFTPLGVTEEDMFWLSAL